LEYKILSLVMEQSGMRNRGPVYRAELTEVNLLL
jgi:hypothetical protein